MNMNLTNNKGPVYGTGTNLVLEYELDHNKGPIYGTGTNLVLEYELDHNKGPVNQSVGSPHTTVGALPYLV